MENKFFNNQEFKKYGAQMIDMVSELHEGLGNIPIQPKVDPGFLRIQFDEKPPVKGEDMNSIMKETREKIFPGITQWQHPGFFAYYPSSVSHPAVLADIFSSTFNSPGFMFSVSPSHTEVENIVVDWLAQLLGLPEHCQLKNSGGGSFQISISDAMFNTVHAAKKRKMKELGITLTDPRILKLVAYYPSHSFQAAEKSLMIKDIGHTRIIPVYFDEKVKNFQPDLEAFKKMLEEDIKEGLIPFWLSLTLGTTPSCAYDPLIPFMEVAKPHNMWINVDAAYAGASWVLEKFRNHNAGLELADSILINCAKFMLIGMNGAVIYVKDKKEYQQSFKMEIKAIVSNAYSGREDCTDYSDWYVGFGRRFNALKLFYVIKYFGQEGLQEHISSKVELSDYFRKIVEDSPDFQIFAAPEVTLTTFRYIGDLKESDLEGINKQNKQLKILLDENTSDGYITPSVVSGMDFLRLVICNGNTTKEHIDKFWAYLLSCVTKVKIMQTETMSQKEA